MNDESDDKLTVLIVDDDGDVRKLLSDCLRGAGYDTAEAVDGQEAVDITARLSPALIVLDLRMPVLNGIAAARRIREMLRDVPIIVTSGLDPERFRQEASFAGCTAYLSKPFDPYELLRLVRSFLHE